MAVENLVTVDDRVVLATVDVYERGLAALRAKIAKLNKRARKHGLRAIGLHVRDSKAVTRKGGVPDIRHKVEISGCAPCINGFRLRARVEFNDLVGTIVHVSPLAPDSFNSVKYRTIGPICEHCHTTRKRNDVFVLADSNGCEKVVGRNCLADYVRTGDAESLAMWAECMDYVGGGIDSDGSDNVDYYDRERASNAMPLEPYLSIVAVVKRTFGWLGRTKARDEGGQGTADIAGYVIYGRGNGHDRFIEENDLHVNEHDSDYAKRAIKWASGLDPDVSNEYMRTIGQIARAEVVDMRTLDGYAASILIAYDMALERDRERAEKAKNAKSKVYYGEPKKRVHNVHVICKGLHSFEGYYGTTTLVRFEHYPNNAEKAILVWFASGDRYNDWEIDSEYDIDFTVKDHSNDSKYGKQTKINRVKNCSG